MPFNRLVRVVDAWAGACGRDDVLAQIGPTDYRPAHIQWTAFLDPADFRQHLFDAEVTITHAGMGTILTSLELGRPILVMPRRGDLQETRNDHQFDTARAFRESGRITVAWNENELLEHLYRLDAIHAPGRIPSHASFQLLSALRRFIRHDAVLPVTEPSEPIVGEVHPMTLHPAGETAPGKAA